MNNEKNKELVTYLRNKLCRNIFSTPWDTLHITMLNNRLNEAEFDEIANEHLYKLYILARRALINKNPNGNYYVSPIAYGQIISILDCLIIENEICWINWKIVHPRIIKSSKGLFADGHFSNAAEDAFIEINDRAKEIYAYSTGNSEEIPDGVDLMNKLFSEKNPLVKISDVHDNISANEQRGYHFLLSGAMSALRNPKAHSNNVVITAEESARRIMFASMLMYKLDDTFEKQITSNVH